VTNWTNYHTHCAFCDGQGEPREYAEAALEQGLTALGFSSHAALPFPNVWSLRPERVAEYCQTVRRLAAEYAGRLDIYLGLEVDYIPGVMAPTDACYQELGLDYVIGSVHFVEQLPSGEHWGIDSSAELFEKGLNEAFGGDIRRVVERYYDLMRHTALDCRPDILGHLDVVKKFNHGERFFRESAPWYREQVFDTLDAVRRSGVILEVNTGHLARGRFPEAYPSRWILDRVLELGVPITLDADAHSPALVAGEFAATTQLLLEVGFREWMALGASGWEARPIGR